VMGSQFAGESTEYPPDTRFCYCVNARSESLIRAILLRDHKI
jgi:hypothetical protein